MPATYTAIATTVLTANTTSVTFSSIPQTYTDLVIVSMGSLATSENSPWIRFNGDATTAYNRQAFYSYSGSVGGSSDAGANRFYFGDIGGGWGTFNQVAINHIANYANTTYNKNILTFANYVDQYGSVSNTIGAACWASTAGISTILISAFASNQFTAGSVFTLYGIKAA